MHPSKINFKVALPFLIQLGRFHAFEKAHRMDEKSTGRGVRQFKTYLLHRLEKVRPVNTVEPFISLFFNYQLLHYGP